MLKRNLYIFGLLIFFVAGIQAQQRIDSILNDYVNHPEYKLVAAHRAAHQKYPENSANAIQEAIRLKVDIVELDVRETKDHELVIIHDRTVDRTTNGYGKVGDLTLAELKKLPLLFNGEVTDQVTLTLEEALQLVKGKILLDIDCKVDTEAAVLNICKLLTKYKMENEVLFYIYDEYKLISLLNQYNAQIKVMPRAYTTTDVKKILLYKDITAMHVDFSFYTDELMHHVFEKQVRVWANALGKYDKQQQETGTGYDAITKLNVNIIQTDYPEELLVFLRKHKLHK